MELEKVLSIDEIRNNTQKALDYLDEGFFTDSTVTLMNDDYIKNSAKDRLSQVVLFSEGIATLNEDPEALSRAMLRASLSDNDINFILNASLKISNVNVSVKTEEEKTEKEKTEEETPENVDKMVKAKLENMGSLESLIGLIKDNTGTSRIVPISSPEAIYAAMEQNLEPENAVRDTLLVERPVMFNLNYLDLSKIENSQIFSFLNSMMACDSNSSLSITFPIDALVDDLRTFYTVDLANIAEAAVAFARTSAKNSISFTAEPDPFLSLFNTL